jgi:hypothetical protein
MWSTDMDELRKVADEMPVDFSRRFVRFAEEVLADGIELRWRRSADDRIDFVVPDLRLLLRIAFRTDISSTSDDEVELQDDGSILVSLWSD